VADFNWNDEESKEDIVIRRVDALSVYGNLHGDLVIRQQDPMGGDESVVIIPIAQVDTLINAIQKAVEILRQTD
jgi:hypothetical protein